MLACIYYVYLPSLQEDLGFILGTPYINFILLSLYYILHLFLDSLALIINLSYIHSMSVLLSLQDCHINYRCRTILHLLQEYLAFILEIFKTHLMNILHSFQDYLTFIIGLYFIHSWTVLHLLQDYLALMIGLSYIYYRTILHSFKDYLACIVLPYIH